MGSALAASLAVGTAYASSAEENRTYPLELVMKGR
jgi:hypothetical protein